MCATDEASDGEADSVASLPKGQGKEEVEEQETLVMANFRALRKLQQGKEEAELERMRRLRRAKERR